MYVLRHKKKESRAKSIEQLLSVMSELRELKDFQCCYALYAGIAHSSISRLSKTWKAVSSNNIKIFDSFKELFNPTKNYKQMTQYVNSQQPPLVPWIGLYNSYLVATEENVDKLPNGFVNFHKLRMLFDVLDELRKFQR